MAQGKEIVIRSEQDAYDTLQLATSGHLPDHVEIRFEGWPTLQIIVKGDNYNGTINPSVMQGFLEFQKAIYRTFSLARYNSANINRLTQDEKDALELWIKVEAGSSKFTVDFQALLERFVEKAGDKLTPKSLVIIALIVATSYFGTSAFKSYLEERRITRVAELQSEERIAELESRRYADEADIKRMQILADAVRDEPRAANVREYAEDAHRDLVRSVRKAEESSIGGLQIEGELASELTKNARRESKEIRLDGRYRVQTVDASQIDVFKIRVKDEETGEEFIAIVQDDTLDSRHRSVIREAEWARTPVQLAINARMVGDEIKKAIVIGAAEIDESRSPRLPR
ncbi:conserved hypothetical protein [Pseudomonas sp. 8Z]|uniref:hypothetical protein n=1 Tax=Pseudomonas sp. 8Z TaxID=2653166 RepID=UPI0012F14D7E|nr:hypothetical protein [Pseudomonas sp. 8Z]VXC72079.1 conserved hypothetical protein [Pseudomonas sp. 8Z]